MEAVAIRLVDSSGVVVTALDTVVLPQILDTTLGSDRLAALSVAIAAGVRAQEKDVGAVESVIELIQDPDGSRRSRVVYRLAKLDDYNKVIDGERYLNKALAGVTGAAQDLNETVHVITVDLTGEKGETLARLRVDYDAAANEVDRAVHFAHGYWPKEWRLHSGVAN